MADVAGKGIPAALIMSTFRALLRTCVRRGRTIAQAVQDVNALLVESIGLPAFVTSVYGVLDPATGRFVYANCGHNAPLVIRARGAVDQLHSSGPFLGVFDGATYVEQETLVQPGDVLVLYTTAWWSLSAIPVKNSVSSVSGRSSPGRATFRPATSFAPQWPPRTRSRARRSTMTTSRWW